MKYPNDASPEMREMLRRVWLILDKWESSPVIDLSGRTFVNVGAASEPSQFVSLSQFNNNTTINNTTGGVTISGADFLEVQIFS